MNRYLEKSIKSVKGIVQFMFSTTALLVVSSFMIGLVAGKNISTGTDSMLFLGGVFGLALYQWIGVRDHQISEKIEKKEVKKAVRKLEKKFDRHVGVQNS